ncbi:unnamed protein product [Candida verbasci]|uniref:Major facilitator superfamily (MFS) profile domain-containing protein n=1 Tax=Candida verbasci TaxID=1227364 RepID=A0A9W4TTK4_9ASCO|nr:unnamed protein product [Candida verbasci]
MVADIHDDVHPTNEVSNFGGKTAFKDYLGKFADVEDPLERRRLALEEIDKAGFGWTQVKMIMIAGVGFMTDSYDIFAINLGIQMLAYVFWRGKIPDSTSTLIKISTSVGTVIGQISFGAIADKLGRKVIYGFELIIMIFATIAQVVVGQAPAINFVAIFVFFRIIQGIGIGGDYPLSSIISSEFSTTKWRGAIMAAVFSNQGLGQIFAGIVGMICVAGYKDELNWVLLKPTKMDCTGSCLRACDQMWRIIIGFGCVPGAIALYYRLTIAESPRYELDVNEHGEIQKTGDPEEPVDINQVRLNIPKASFKDFCLHFGRWKYGKILLGTAGSWFMLDVAYYGMGLNSTTILDVIGYGDADNLYQKFYNLAAGNLIIVCAGALPGYWFSAATIDTVGRKPIQFMGFFLLTVILCIMGFGYHKVGKKGIFGLYVVAQFFQNFGPNTTTFIVPGECFPTRYRSTAHGMSAAAGKVGAIIAQTCIGTLINHNCAADDQGCYLPHVLEIFALFMLLGIFLTFLIPETKRKTLEEICELYHDEVDTTKLVRDRYTTQEESYDSDVKQ